MIGWGVSLSDEQGQISRAHLIDGLMWRYCRPCDVFTKDATCWACGGRDLIFEAPPNATGSAQVHRHEGAT